MKSYGELVMATREENALFSVLLELTYHCNLDCFFCYNDVHLAGRPLQLEQYYGLLDDLAEMQLVVGGMGQNPVDHVEDAAVADE